MALFGNREKKHFPLKCIRDVIGLFDEQLNSTTEPNLTLLSIVLGTVENMLTIRPNRNHYHHNDNHNDIDNYKNNTYPYEGDHNDNHNVFPTIELSTIESLYNKFRAHVVGTIDLTIYDRQSTSDQHLIKNISDVIWNSLARNYYKDRAHLQYLFSYLTGKITI